MIDKSTQPTRFEVKTMFNDYDSFGDKALAALIYVGLPVFCASFVIGGPIAAWYSAGVEQKAINAQCGTNYSQVAVLFSSKSLTQLCRIEKQQLTINQK